MPIMGGERFVIEDTMQPRFTTIKDGWAAFGDGWAVFGATKEQAQAEFRRAEDLISGVTSKTTLGHEHDQSGKGSDTGGR
jgi:hypothetical protein